MTHPDRILYPGTALTKLNVARYYTAVAKWALPHLFHRLLTLVRATAVGKTFYQKHVGPEAPDAIRRFELDDGDGSKIYPYIENLPGLVALVQMDVVEIHLWGSTINQIDNPDRVTFDLDPDDGLPWQRITEAAVQLREALFWIGLKSFAKTTGGKGLHVVVPLVPKLGWDEVRAFAESMADSFAAQRPQDFTANMAMTARRGRIYVDYLRNNRGATAVGAYTPRARECAPVSTPLLWDEVKNGVRPEGFTVDTVPQRLARFDSDPWADIGKLRQSLSTAVRRRFGT